MRVCLRCGITMGEEEYGYNADGSRNTDYCKYCYINGDFAKEETSEEMIESCIPLWIENEGCRTPEEAEERIRKLLPT